LALNDALYKRQNGRSRPMPGSMAASIIFWVSEYAVYYLYTYLIQSDAALMFPWFDPHTPEFM
jgi:hypothetical protein